MTPSLALSTLTTSNSEVDLAYLLAAVVYVATPFSCLIHPQLRILATVIYQADSLVDLCLGIRSGLHLRSVAPRQTLHGGAVPH
jgi:hypothetical protein